MTSLPESLKQWKSTGFNQALKVELEALGGDALQLQRASTHGGMIHDHSISATIINTTENQASLVIRAGIFFTEIIGGCSCGDEPFEANGYCEIEITLDKTTAEASVALLDGV